jgi:hypothetical protein
MPELEPVTIDQLAEYRSHLVDFPCYRLLPFYGIGAGGFVALLKNSKTGSNKSFSINSFKVVWSNE